MKTFILVGEIAVSLFQYSDWNLLEKAILEQNRGDIITWNKETDNISELLEQLRGWNDFIELSEQDLKDIEANTKIEIDPKFPNDFESWQETHFEIVSMIIIDLEKSNNKIEEISETKGTGGLYTLAKQLTDKFEKLHVGREWDGDFFEEIEYFYTQELKKL